MARRDRAQAQPRARPLTFHEWAELGFKSRETILGADAADLSHLPSKTKTFLRAAIALIRKKRKPANSDLVDSDAEDERNEGDDAEVEDSDQEPSNNVDDQSVLHSDDSDSDDDQDTSDEADHPDFVVDDDDEEGTNASDNEEIGSHPTPADGLRLAKSSSLSKRSAIEALGESLASSNSRPCKVPRTQQHRWGSIINTHSFKVPKPVEDHVRRFGSHPIKFLCDAEATGVDLIKAESMQTGNSWLFALGARWKYMDTIEGRLNGIDPARRISYLLLVRDLVTLIDPDANPERPTKATMAAMKLLLGHLGDHRRNFDRNDAAKKLWQRFKFGTKLHHLNSHFNDGAAFVLASKLSPDFLQHKSPPSMFRDQAYCHLEQDGSFMKACHTVNELATNVREFLIAPFREKLQQIGHISRHSPCPTTTKTTSRLGSNEASIDREVLKELREHCARRTSNTRKTATTGQKGSRKVVPVTQTTRTVDDSMTHTTDGRKGRDNEDGEESDHPAKSPRAVPAQLPTPAATPRSKLSSWLLRRW